jgi:hypothetical protein
MNATLKPVRHFRITFALPPFKGRQQKIMPMTVSTRSRSEAVAHFWRIFVGWGNIDTTLDEFRSFSSIEEVPDHPGFYGRVLVRGIPATRVFGYENHIRYLRDDSDEIQLAHPSEVTQIHQHKG